MILIDIEYTAAIEDIDAHLVEHRDFLENGYQQGYFLASGPKEPRTGGVIISLMNEVDALEKVMANDPFVKHSLATYRYVPFQAVKHRDEIKDLI